MPNLVGLFYTLSDDENGVSNEKGKVSRQVMKTLSHGLCIWQKVISTST